MMMADARNKSITGTARLMWADGGVRGLFKVLPRSTGARRSTHRCYMCVHKDMAAARSFC